MDCFVIKAYRVSLTEFLVEVGFENAHKWRAKNSVSYAIYRKAGY